LSDLRQGILNEITRLATLDSDRPPGQKLFAKETGIAEHKWRGVFWVCWGDALRDAGFRPNEWTTKLDSEVMLKKIAKTICDTGRFLTNSEIDLRRRLDSTIPSSSRIRAHFGGKADLIRALISLAHEDTEFSDILDIVTDEPKLKSKENKLLAIDTWVYLIKSGENYKIGRSENLERRVKQINVALPEPANLYHAIQTDDSAGIEAYWHNRFADRRLNGEWFKLTKQDVAAFKRRKFQ
jgi:hypothetical protein